MENIYELDDDSVEVTRSYLLGLDYKQPDAVDEALSAMGQILIRITACQIFLVGMHDEGDLLKAGALDSILAARARFYGRLLADCKSRHELTPLGDVFARALTEAERLVPEIESLAKKLLELFADRPAFR
ncbi:MAG: hypothetical protein LBI62_00215 [Candidatus Accumulibacter sp.]|jgi:hypothetical protein|nr:hypothetical protein [Accumulibacter sp.]